MENGEANDAFLYLPLVALSNMLRDRAGMSHRMFVMFNFLSICCYTMYQHQIRRSYRAETSVQNTEILSIPSCIRHQQVTRRRLGV